MGQVQTSNIPANLRVPLFYAEINAGPNAYQGPSRLLVIGQRTAAGSLAANAIVRLDGDPQALGGAGSHLAEAALYASEPPVW